MSADEPEIKIRNTTEADLDQIIEISHLIYENVPWSRKQLESHLKVFPEGQFVAVEIETGEIAGMAASLIISWDDYEMHDDWRSFTDDGMFTNHDPSGRTLYGAEIMVHPEWQGYGVGSMLYEKRWELAERLGLLRIRAGARLAGYHRYAEEMSAGEYVKQVIQGRITDPTLTFQLNRGFHVLAVVPKYLWFDEESLGYAAVIEWINENVAKPEDYAGRRDFVG